MSLHVNTVGYSIHLITYDFQTNYRLYLRNALFDYIQEASIFILNSERHTNR